MSEPYRLDDNEEGEQTIYRWSKPMSLAETVCELSDIYEENQRLKQRFNNLRDKLIRFAEKEVGDEPK
jgi:hypothetical protein